MPSVTTTHLGGAGYTDAEMTAANAMIELAQSGAPATVPSGPSDASGYDSDASTVGFPTPPPGATVSPGSPLYDDDDRTPDWYRSVRGTMRHQNVTCEVPA